MSAVTASHIEVDDQGVAWITGSNTKVIEIVVDKLAHESSPEEMHLQYPHLSLAEIHAALSYYYDHQAELDVEIDRRRREADDLSKKASDPVLRRRLLSLKNPR